MTERRVVVALGALFAAVGFTTQWFAPPHGDTLWLVIWELVAGVGFLAAGCLVPAGRLLLLVGILLTASPAVLAAGLINVSNALWLFAVLAVGPLAVLHVVRPPPIPTVMRTFDGLIVACGLLGSVGALFDAVVLEALAATAGGTVVLCAGWVLFELTDGDDRRRVLWIVLGGGFTVPTAALLLVALDDAGPAGIVLCIVMALLTLALPLTATIALVNPRVVDVRDVIHRVVVLTVMFALAAALYIGVETGVQAFTGTVPDRGIRTLTAVAIAVAFHPMMRWVRTSMDEMLFGGRADPVDTLTRLGTHMAAGATPSQWLDTLRIALAVSGIELRRGTEVVASSGRLDGTAATTELWADGEHVGDLHVALPGEQLHLAAQTVAVLGLIAAPLAQTLYADRLTEQLRASRSRVVTALEEERRRVRRDLHDGLGPALTGIAYTADAAANLLRSEPDEASKILRQLRADTGEAIAEIRRIVYGLRPKALDELGLVAAVRQQISHLRAAEGQVLTVDLTAPASLPNLPAAVEVAAYRVAVEAVTNVARHAGVATATVDFAMIEGPALRIEVSDGGRSTAPWQTGVGLSSMRERVEQIGGNLVIRSGVDGSQVTANIPLDVPAA